MRSRELQTISDHDAVAAIGKILGDQFVELGGDPFGLASVTVLPANSLVVSLSRSLPFAPFLTLEKRKGEAAHNEIYYVQARSATKLKSQAMELGNRSATIGEKRGYPISAISEVSENLSRLYFPSRAR